MSPEQAEAVLEREGWTLSDLYHLIEVYVASTACAFDLRGPRVRITVKSLPLRKKAAKKVKP